MMTLTCAQFESFMMDYLDTRLAAPQHAAFEEHIEDCASCRSYLERYRHTIALGQQAFAHPDEPVPDNVPHELLEGILLAIESETSKT